jgi:hypothetical protein
VTAATVRCAPTAATVAGHVAGCASSALEFIVYKQPQSSALLRGLATCEVPGLQPRVRNSHPAPTRVSRAFSGAKGWAIQEKACSSKGTANVHVRDICDEHDHGRSAGQLLDSAPHTSDYGSAVSLRPMRTTSRRDRASAIRDCFWGLATEKAVLERLVIIESCSS